MSNTSRKIETYLRTHNPTQVTGLSEQKIKEVVGTISHRQGQVWQNESGVYGASAASF